MKVQGIDEFAAEVKNRFETEAVTAVKNALCLQYPFSDMLRIICIYIKHTKDSLVNEEAFVADGAELIVVAPALKEFGEDKTIDTLIRKYGYKGTPHTLEATAANKDLQDNLGASAHLIHGSSEGRFTITYCPGPEMTREEIEGVGFNYGVLDEVLARYPLDKLKDGWNTMPDGEEVYYISNPALGLWAYPGRFKD